MEELRLYLLGPFRALLAERPVVGFAYDKVRALLAYLSIESHLPHTREQLATLLWPESNPETGRTNLRKALSILRKAICGDSVSQPYLFIGTDTVQFNPHSRHWLDVVALQSKLGGCQQHAHPQLETCAACASDLEEAVQLYQGDFLQGMIVDSQVFEEWSLVLRENFHARILTALHELTIHYLYRGEYAQAQQYALRQIEMEPFREEAHRALMTILACSGQRSAALAQYDTCRRLLNQQLRIEPGSETRELYERIRSAGQTCAHNLPLPLSDLVGRNAELQIIGARLANPNCRLLTLVGIGGIGKTSLALHAARGHLGNFWHGVFWVSLASVRHPDQILTAIINTLPVPLRASAEPKAQLLDYLRGKSILLALDNLEHLLPSAQAGCKTGLELINDILQSAPHVKLLVTSRERLNLRAEWVIPVEGLPYPANQERAGGRTLPEYAAVQLFVRRAQQAAADFTPNEAEYQQIARICQRLYGIPLGIELAAGWVHAAAIGTQPAQTCQAIADIIERDPNTLVATLIDTPDRHQSLRAVFTHSWNLLTAGEQTILRKLSVFRSSFTHKAASEISGAHGAILTGFVNKSFLHTDSSGRYSLHPLLKEFLAEELAAHSAEDESTRQTHASFYARLLKASEAQCIIQSQTEQLDEAGDAITDMLAAWDWAADHHAADLLAQMLDSLFIYFWAHNQFYEGQARFAKAAQMVKAHTDQPHNRLLLARLLHRLAEFMSWLGELTEAETLARQGIGIVQSLETDNGDELAYANELLGRISYWQGDFRQAKDSLAAAIEIARQSGAQHSLAHALCSMANVLCDECGDHPTANTLYSESLRIYETLGNRVGIAKVLINQGGVFYDIGDYQQARDYYQRSLEIYRQTGYLYGASAALNNLSIVTRRLGDSESAKEMIAESLALKRETGNRVSILHSLLESGSLHLELSDYEAAHAQFSEALQVALELQANALLFDVLVGYAELFNKQGQSEQAAQIVAFTLSQEGIGQETREQACALHAELERMLPAQDLARCRQRAGAMDINRVVAEIVAFTASRIAD